MNAESGGTRLLSSSSLPGLSRLVAMKMNGATMAWPSGIARCPSALTDEGPPVASIRVVSRPTCLGKTVDAVGQVAGSDQPSHHRLAQADHVDVPHRLAPARTHRVTR